MNTKRAAFVSLAAQLKVSQKGKEMIADVTILGFTPDGLAFMVCLIAAMVFFFWLMLHKPKD